LTYIDAWRVFPDQQADTACRLRCWFHFWNCVKPAEKCSHAYGAVQFGARIPAIFQLSLVFAITSAGRVI
jgi:hypothetical protein